MHDSARGGRAHVAQSGIVMKVVLDLSRLLQDGKITQEEHDRLLRFAARETGSLAINILIGLGVIAVSGGVLALLMNATAVIVLGAIILAAGIVITYALARQWSVLATIFTLVGALMVAGGIVALGEANLSSLLLGTLVLTACGIAGRSSLLIGLAVLGLAGCVGASTAYWHASYELTITQPTVTIVLFSALALVAYLASHRVPAGYEPLALMAARVSVFLVNFGFWIGSLWGDSLSLPRALLHLDPGGVNATAERVIVPSMVFIVGWAAALLATGAWAVKANRRWVVNLVAVFGAIHFYTQWFERLGATPMSVLLGGLLVLAFATAAWKFNQRFTDAAAT
jgi:iron complex transport system permease protein